jgi:hypothetical protein
VPFFPELPLGEHCVLAAQLGVVSFKGCWSPFSCFLLLLLILILFLLIALIATFLGCSNTYREPTLPNVRYGSLADFG